MQIHHSRLALVTLAIILLASQDALARRKQTIDKIPARASDDSQYQKTLDLSVPFKITPVEHAELKQTATTKESNLFPSKKKSENSPLQLKGHVFLTPDQEIEKRKSFDGAGIVINLKQ